MINPLIDPRYLQIPLMLEINEEDPVRLVAQESYPSLFKDLQLKYSFSEKLDYIDDYGEHHEITDQQSYVEALMCTNGQAHYFRIKDAKNKSKSIENINRVWRCTRCLFENPIKNAACQVCKLPKPNTT